MRVDHICKNDYNVKTITMINKISPFERHTSTKLTTLSCLSRFRIRISRRAVIGNWKRKIIFKTHKFYFLYPATTVYESIQKIDKRNFEHWKIEVGSTHMTGMEVGSTMSASHWFAHFLRLDRRSKKTTMEPSKSFSFITKPSFIYLNPTRFQ